MQTSLLITAFMNGLIGSLHCLGMCGPIVWIVQSKSENSWKTNLVYNLGRTISYTTIGGILGFFGWSMNRFFLADLAFWTGIVLLVLVALNYFFPKIFYFKLGNYQSKYFSSFIKKVSQIQNPNFLAFSFGLISGLLPCGLLYPAYGLALLSSSFSMGSLVMFTFSLGTYPTMLGINFFNQKLKTLFTESKYSSVLGLVLLLFVAYSIFYRFNLKEDENCHTPIQK